MLPVDPHLMYRYRVKQHCVDGALCANSVCNPQGFLSDSRDISILFLFTVCLTFVAAPLVLCFRLSRRWVSEVPDCVPWLSALCDWRSVWKIVSGGRTLGEAIGYPRCGWSTLRMAGRQGTEVVYLTRVTQIQRWYFGGGVVHFTDQCFWI